MNSDSILILGTGALATLFAARLAAAGVFVTMLGTWPEGLAALSEKGVRVDGDDRAFHVHATDNPAECKGMRFALVLVKAWQTERAARQLADCLAEDGVALTLQNGLGNDTVLAGTLGLPRVARGVTTLGATLLAPGLVHLGGEGPVSLESHARLFPLEEMIRQRHYSPEYAVSRTLRRYAQVFQRLESSHLAERASDIFDIEKRLLRHLLGRRR